MRMELPHQFYLACDEVIRANERIQQPHVLLKPKFGREGNQYYFLLGDCVRTGCVGFGNTPALAAQDFDKQWYSDGLSKDETKK